VRQAALLKLKQACWQLWRRLISCTGGPLWRRWQCRHLSCCGWRPRCWPLLDSPPWCASTRHLQPKLEPIPQVLHHSSELDTPQAVRLRAVAAVRQTSGRCNPEPECPLRSGRKAAACRARGVRVPAGTRGASPTPAHGHACAADAQGTGDGVHELLHASGIVHGPGAGLVPRSHR
jgi:hypothetical protein